MPLGNVEPFNSAVKTFDKATNAQIPLGKICIPDTSLSPDGMKASTTLTAQGPFCVAVNKLYSASSPTFAGAIAPSEVIVEAGGNLEPNMIVKSDATGKAIAAVVGTDAEVTHVGIYLGKEGELRGSSAVSGDKIRVKLI